MSAVQNIGCHECAWGKVLGCWRCGSRVTLYSSAAQLRARSAEPQPVLPPRDFEPHCVFNERDHWDGADSIADWAAEHLEQFK
jgi:hypothetical protein